MRLTNSFAAVKVPATSANLGPGFDCMGLALGISDRVHVRAVATGSTHVSIRGEGADTLPRDDNHLIVKVLRAALDVVGAPQVGLELFCENSIPQSRGLGSSAAAITAGLMLARGLISEPGVFDNDTLLRLATQLEGHPDNVAAAIYGGVVLTGTYRDLSAPEKAAARQASSFFPPVPREGHHVKQQNGAPKFSFGSTRVSPFGVSARDLPGELDVDREELDFAHDIGLNPHELPHTWAVEVHTAYPLTPTVFIPDFELSTSQARSYLPEMVPQRDAVANSTNTALLLCALTNRPDLLFQATYDYVHQDYRRAGMPQSLDLMYWLRSLGYPAVISGAGPTVLVLGSVDDQHKMNAEKNGWKVRTMPINPQGATLIS